MAIEEYGAYFIEDQAIFGAYPTQDRVNALERLGIDIIVDLTEPGESKCTPYTTSAIVHKFPISDRSVPADRYAFCALILLLVDELTKGSKIFIHCKGGHGRAGMLVAAIICHRERISPVEAIAKTTMYHGKRASLKPYWAKVGSPQTMEQKQFIRSIFQRHIVSEISPFHECTIKDEYLDKFLLQTYLGQIEGVNGADLERRRSKLLFKQYTVKSRGPRRLAYQ